MASNQKKSTHLVNKCKFACTFAPVLKCRTSFITRCNSTYMRSKGHNSKLIKQTQLLAFFFAKTLVLFSCHKTDKNVECNVIKIFCGCFHIFRSGNLIFNFSVMIFLLKIAMFFSPETTPDVNYYQVPSSCSSH